MTSTIKTIKIASIVLAVIMLLSTFCIMGTASASAVTDKVSLYSSSVYFAKYGFANYEVFVQTKDNGNNQKVYIHYNYLDNTEWKDTEAKYYKTLSDGSKIWKASFCSYNCRYAIKLVSNGREYWDNNGGKDYTGDNIIGSAPVASERLGYQSYYLYGGFRVNAILQNYAYHKNVFVRYTTDSWNSYRDQSLSYSATNADGTETWTTNLNFNGVYDAKKFQYAICYKVNGREYWANNFGDNYDGTYYIYH